MVVGAPLRCSLCPGLSPSAGPAGEGECIAWLFLAGCGWAHIGWKLHSFYTIYKNIPAEKQTRKQIRSGDWHRRQLRFSFTPSSTLLLHLLCSLGPLNHCTALFLLPVAVLVWFWRCNLPGLKAVECEG